MRNRTLLTALLIIVAIAALTITVVHLRAPRGPVIYAQLATAPGIREGAPVSFRGIVVGQVSRIAFVPGGVRLTLALNRRDVPLRQGDGVRMKPNGLLGDMALVIVPGPATALEAKDGAVLHEVPPDAESLRQQAIGEALLERFKAGLTKGSSPDSRPTAGARP
jgi:ABC-type transporter Mla subunit MlaD